MLLFWNLFESNIIYLTMDLSYWERKTWLADIDFAIIGSGIVGLNCALSLRKKFPKSKIVIFEKGMLPSGANKYY